MNNSQRAEERRQARIDAVYMVIPSPDEDFKTADQMATELNKRYKSPRPWRRVDVYRAVRELRQSYPDLAVTSLPRLGFKFESDTTDTHQRSKMWAARSSVARLRTSFSGQLIPLATPSQRKLLERSFTRLEEDVQDAFETVA